MEKIVVGIDIGGTNTTFGFVNHEGKIIATGSIRTDEFEEFDAYLKKLVSEIKKVFNTVTDSVEITGYGTGAPNANYFRGTIEDAPNLKWNGSVSYNASLSKLTGKPSFLTNDANAAALGEKLFGNATDLDDFIVITLGTGLGSGIFCGGKLLYGSTGHAGELGHVIVKENGRLCGCGRNGCLETYASATGITNTVKELIEKDFNSVLKEIKPDSFNSEMIYEAALKGDKLAIEAFEITGGILGKALANAAALFSPQAIFLAGGLANAGDYILKPTIKHFENNLLNIYKNTVKILTSGLEQNKAAILGAAALCWNEMNI